MRSTSAGQGRAGSLRTCFSLGCTWNWEVVALMTALSSSCKRRGQAGLPPTKGPGPGARAAWNFLHSRRKDKPDLGCAQVQLQRQLARGRLAMVSPRETWPLASLNLSPATAR